jgi:hypothetical protein
VTGVARQASQVSPAFQASQAKLAKITWVSVIYGEIEE